MIYFIQDGLSNIKIGHAQDPEARLRQLQTANSAKLTLLTVCEGCPGLENLVQWHYDPWCVRGEWFSPSPEVLALVEHVKANGGLVGYESGIAVERKPKWERWWASIPPGRAHSTVIFDGHFILVESSTASFFVSADDEFKSCLRGTSFSLSFLSRPALAGCPCGKDLWKDYETMRTINRAADAYKSGRWGDLRVAAEKLAALKATTPESYVQRHAGLVLTDIGEEVGTSAPEGAVRCLTTET